MGFLALIPLRVWLAIGLLVSFALGVAWIDHRGYSRGKAECMEERRAEREAALAKIAQLQAEKDKVSEKVVTVYRDRVKVVKEKGDEIVREIPVLVGMDSPLLSGSYRMLHDAAVTGRMPDDPAGAARAADPVEAVALLRTTAENYSACAVNSERLSALQEILKGKP